MSAFRQSRVRGARLAKALTQGNVSPEEVSGLSPLDLSYLLSGLEKVVDVSPALLSALGLEKADSRESREKVIKHIARCYRRAWQVATANECRLQWVTGNFFAFMGGDVPIVHYRLMPDKDKAGAVSDWLVSKELADLTARSPIGVLRNHLHKYSESSCELKIWGLRPAGYQAIAGRERLNESLALRCGKKQSLPLGRSAGPL